MSCNILVALAADEATKTAIKIAASLAKANNTTLTAIYVETPIDKNYTDKQRKLLKYNIKLAEENGASINTVYGTKPEEPLTEFASISGTNTLVMSKPRENRISDFIFGGYINRINKMLPNVDICIVPSSLNRKRVIDNFYIPFKTNFLNLSDFIKTITILIAINFIGKILLTTGFSEFNIIPLYILGVLITSLWCHNQLWSIINCISSVVLYNYFFTYPYFTLKANDVNYPIAFLIMLTVSIIVSLLTSKSKLQAINASEKAYRTEVFLETIRSLEFADSFDKILDETATNIQKMLNRLTICYYNDSPNAKGHLKFKIFNTPNNNRDISRYITKDEQTVAQWVFSNNHRAGAGTNTFPTSKCIYLAIRQNTTVYAVIGIALDNDILSTFETNLLITLLSECSLSIDKFLLNKQKMEAELKAEKEQYQNTLLRTISHDLRTPLTSIYGNAYLLMQDDKKITLENKLKIYKDIYENAQWLYSLVENLLSSSRISGLDIESSKQPEILREVVDEAITHVTRKDKKYNLTINEIDELLLSNVDARLIMQVIINLIDNAIKYSMDPPIEIEIVITRKDNFAIIMVKDNGLGIKDTDKEHIFDTFYSGNNKIADSHRGMGLGLALCKSIVELHGGTIDFYKNNPRGSVFYFTLPLINGGELC